MQRPGPTGSLRRAQLMLINNQVPGEDFRQPRFRAPFGLMGGWR